LTGKGHLTEDAMLESVSPSTIEFSTKIDTSKFANTIVVLGYKGDELIVTEEVKSTGGGRMVFVGRESEEVHVYPHKSFNEIKTYCRNNNLSLYDYVLQFEGPEIVQFLKEIWNAMKASVERGISTDGILPGPLKVQRKAKTLH
jgi:L-serine dehydratase